MNFKYLIKNKNKQIIVFFQGWGLDAECVSHLGAADTDLLIFYNYKTFEIPSQVVEEINTYEKAYVIGFSLGVSVVAQVCNRLKNIHQTIAINGTILPVDNQYGIPEKVFDLTLNNLNQDVLKKFRTKMFVNPHDERKLSAPKLSIENLKNELEFFKCQKGNQEFQFDKAFVGKYDKIFSPKNQIHYWEKVGTKIVELNEGHFPFFALENWDELL